MNFPPPQARRPADGEKVSDGRLLLLWLDSIPCVRSGCEPPANAPMTPEECELISAYLRKRGGPAAHGEATRREPPQAR